MKTTHNSIEDAEKALNHKWIPPTEKPKEHPVDYKVADFGQDSDIKASLKNLESQEKIHGKWELPQEDV